MVFPPDQPCHRRIFRAFQFYGRTDQRSARGIRFRGGDEPNEQRGGLASHSLFDQPIKFFELSEQGFDFLIPHELTRIIHARSTHEETILLIIIAR